MLGVAGVNCATGYVLYVSLLISSPDHDLIAKVRLLEEQNAELSSQLVAGKERVTANSFLYNDVIRLVCSYRKHPCKRLPRR